MDKQVSLMNLMLKMTENVPDATVQTITYKRKAHKRKRADLLESISVEEVHHELGDKHCPDCHHELIEIGRQFNKNYCLSQLNSKGWIISNMLTNVNIAVKEILVTRSLKLQDLRLP